VRAWMGASAGGGPVMSQRWAGHASATVVCTERWEAWLPQCAAREPPRAWSADAPCSTAAQAPTGARLPCLTRMPETWTVTRQVLELAWAWGAGPPRQETVHSQRVAWCQDGMAPRWWVVAAQAAWPRAAWRRATAPARAAAQGPPPLVPLQAQRLPSATDAQAAWETLAQRGRSQQSAQGSLAPPRQAARPGRPTQPPPGPALQWPIHASVRPDLATLTRQQPRQAWCVRGTTRPGTALTEAASVAGATGHSAVERGGRLRKAPVFFVSSLCVKKPSRRHGLVRVMPLALVVSAVAQRRLRPPGASPHDTRPTQSGPPAARPTLRGVGHLLAGLKRVTLAVPGHVPIVLEGLTALRRKMLQLFGQKVCQIDQISPG